ncbi:MAG TPA: DUF6438 domain-containing protein [Bacteroidia bacterium]|nr:hypothetical protein [Bacteroidia bacterium]QQR96084.1 MAG: hypothetical protein IPJ93_05295 [Bacteroidota bacterium]MBP7713677.1 hypothetical protein [Bacteroidia bacterium]MBP8667482.1 hypothetical protein [Bacteroidia bacterium]HOZ82220.1 DUF6438 domain-containing protein [Bacteroidia bacterium]
MKQANLFFVPITILLLSAIFSCNTSKKVSENNSADSLLISMSRFPCFGRCPYYDASLYKSGYAVINRKGFMDSLGIYATQIDKQELNNFVEDAKKAGLIAMPDSFYNPGIADYPATIVTVNLNGKRKRIFDGVPESPSSLKDFEEKVHLFFTAPNRQWKLIQKPAQQQD